MPSEAMVFIDEVVASFPSYLSLNTSFYRLGFAGGSDSRESACNARGLGLLPGSGNLLEKRMATFT